MLKQARLPNSIKFENYLLIQLGDDMSLFRPEVVSEFLICGDVCFRLARSTQSGPEKIWRNQAEG
jgi:hypothetical protein